ncbi:hypothetical protein ACQKGD_07880 [Peribacillus frigoritolerans]|uniref:hypothetical protein n=1 Tax=Peribacillus frigoritolerans TaxID=450367 RepID=UPI0007BEBF73|nr:hypothetical protein [Peribacillus frigoritolerans]USK64513.1 hypothetical protein LIT26_25760 [Peribacillus frigoritolerans]
MVKLRGQEKLILLLFTLWVLLAVQFVGQELIKIEEDFITENNIFKTKEIMLVFLNFVIMFFSVLFLLFQSFIYRFILLLFKSEKNPSVLTSFYYLIISYLPSSLSIIAVNFIDTINLFAIATNLYFKVGSMVIVNLVYMFIVVKKGFIEYKKALVMWIFLTLINLLFLININ